MISKLRATTSTREVLGSRGLKLAAERLSDFHADCLTCGQVLDGHPVSVSTLVRRGYTAAIAHHADCPAPDFTRSAHLNTTYTISPLLLDGQLVLVVHPSSEMVWLQQTTGLRPQWVDTTHTAFTALGFSVPRPDRQSAAGFAFPALVPDAGVWFSGGELHLGVPPSVRWSISVPREATQLVAEAGGAVVVITTALDHRAVTPKSINRLLSSCKNYVTGFVEQTAGPRETRSQTVTIDHPMLIGAVQPTNARVLFLDDPDLGRDAIRINTRHGVEVLGQDTDQLPVVLFEPTTGVLQPDLGLDVNVEALILQGLPRLAAGYLLEALEWKVVYRDGELLLLDPRGVEHAQDSLTLPPDWISSALGHGRVLALYGPLLGVRRDDGNAEFTPRDEFEHSLTHGLIAGAVVTYEHHPRLDRSGQA